MTPRWPWPNIRTDATAGCGGDLLDIRWIIAHIGGTVPYLMERMDNGLRRLRRMPRED